MTAKPMRPISPLKLVKRWDGVKWRTYVGADIVERKKFGWKLERRSIRFLIGFLIYDTGHLIVGEYSPARYASG